MTNSNHNIRIVDFGPCSRRIARPTERLLRQYAIYNFEISRIAVVDVSGKCESCVTWELHFAAAHGVVLVLDTSDCRRFGSLHRHLSDLVAHRKVERRSRSLCRLNYCRFMFFATCIKCLLQGYA